METKDQTIKSRDIVNQTTVTQEMQGKTKNTS